LYVADNSRNGFLRVYDLPLTASSRPTTKLAFDSSFATAASPKYVAMVLLNDTLNIFKAPIRSSSKAIAAIAHTSDGKMFWRRGNLYLADAANIDVYAPPFTDASKPAREIALPGVQAQEMARGRKGLLYINDGVNLFEAIKGGKVIATVHAVPATQFRGLAASPTRLYVTGFIANGHGGFNNFVDAYKLPLKSGARPLQRVTKGLFDVEDCAVDSKGNLYVGQTNGTISVYSQPITGKSAPAVTLKNGSDTFGLSIGP
jgi:hypothetical protein